MEREQQRKADGKKIVGGKVKGKTGEEEAGGNKWAVQKQFCQQPCVGRNGGEEK